MLWPLGPGARILEFEMTAGPGLATRRAPSALPPALGALAELEFRLGDWAAAHAAAVEALRTARRWELDHEIRCGLTRVAVIEAGMGREQDCRSHASEAMFLTEVAADWPLQALAGEALGLLELGLGRRRRRGRATRGGGANLPRASRGSRLRRQLGGRPR